MHCDYLLYSYAQKDVEAAAFSFAQLKGNPAHVDQPVPAKKRALSHGDVPGGNDSLDKRRK